MLLEVNFAQVRCDQRTTFKVHAYTHTIQRTPLCVPIINKQNNHLALVRIDYRVFPTVQSESGGLSVTFAARRIQKRLSSDRAFLLSPRQCKACALSTSLCTRHSPLKCKSAPWINLLHPSNLGSLFGACVPLTPACTFEDCLGKLDIVRTAVDDKNRSYSAPYHRSCHCSRSLRNHKLTTFLSDHALLKRSPSIVGECWRLVLLDATRR